MSRSVDVVIRNELAEIAAVRDALDELGGELDVPARAIMQMQVALDEIVSNVVKYSWPEGGIHELLVRITVDSGGVALDIFDDGRPFDPRDAPERDPPPPGRRPLPGGVGIHMVRQLVDHLTYERVDGRNHTSLVKKCAVGAVFKEDLSMNTSALNIGQSHEGGVCVVTLSGRIDSTNANALMERLKNLLTSGEKSIVVDLGAVLYLTSAAFRALLVATDEAERNAAKFVLCSLVGHVRELFEMGGLLEVFTIHPSRAEAVAKIG